MKKQYLGLEFEILYDGLFSDVMIASTPDNLIDDDLYDEVIL